jgi:cell division protein FtsL
MFCGSFYCEFENIFYLAALIFYLYYFVKSIIYALDAYVLQSKISALREPREYYFKELTELEATIKDKDNIDMMLKGAYVNELAQALTRNNIIVFKKEEKYYKAFKYSVVTFIPLMLCLIFHLLKDPKPTKVIILNSNKSRTFVCDTLGKGVKTNVFVH